ncbi:MAG: TIGR04255 family protein [Deltaproteobacteria bacterium]|nr:TIGR04255 family protein [Deltaproteobacteria bacterium]MBI5809605.1 TIGR04255 family protein [Deltaproteobacteria bacterium]
MAKELKNKPLVEAILEIRWGLQGVSPGTQIDPHYKLLLGRLFDRMLKDYPEHEQLPTANIPDEMVGHVVQHRFRVAANSWPLVQVGPGVFTVNSTADYKWPDFRPRVLSAIGKLYDAHPKVGELKVTNLILRYIDAVDFDYGAANVFEFMKDKLKLNISMPDNLFKGTDVESKPNGLTWQCAFKCERPKGIINVRFATGQKGSTPALVWETTVQSAEDDLPEMPKDFEGWLDAAHEITDDWFFKMIEGELERRFSGE